MTVLRGRLPQRDVRCGVRGSGFDGVEAGTLCARAPDEGCSLEPVSEIVWRHIETHASDLFKWIQVWNLVSEYPKPAWKSCRRSVCQSIVDSVPEFAPYLHRRPFFHLLDSSNSCHTPGLGLSWHLPSHLPSRPHLTRPGSSVAAGSPRQWLHGANVKLGLNPQGTLFSTDRCWARSGTGHEGWT